MPALLFLIPAFALHHNYLNPSTIIRYQLPGIVGRYDIPTYMVTLKIYNMLGQEVATLADEQHETGYKSAEWNAGNYPSGVYVYRLNAEVEGEMVSFVKKLVLVKWQVVESMGPLILQSRLVRLPKSTGENPCQISEICNLWM